MSTPGTTIYICSGVRLNNTYDHTIAFTDRISQMAYFRSKVVKTFTGYAYLRKRWSLKVTATMREARTWSYLFFTNPDPVTVVQKEAYYFITDVEYINDATVELTLELDVMQTYAFDYSLQDCLVEREHSVNDVFGENTNDEGLDLGELIPVDSSMVDMTDCSILIMSTIDLESLHTEGKYYRYLGMLNDDVFSAVGVYAMDIENYTRLGSLLYQLDTDGKTDSILNIWMYPTALLDIDRGHIEGDTVVKPVVQKVGATSKPMTVTAKRPDTMAGGYKPVNKKLLQYPFSLLYVTNNMGSAATYRYEWWDTDDGADYDAAFRINGTVAGDASVKMYPTYYHHVTDNWDYDSGITLSGFPTCAWNCDTYKLWLAQNQNQHSLARTTNVVQAVVGVGTAVVGAAATVTGVGALVGGASIASGIGMTASAFQSAAQMNAQSRDMAVQPPAARGSHSASVNFVAKRHGFQIIHKSIDPYHAKRLDDFFTMFGYKTCLVKKPNVNSRPHFNYVKTAGSNVAGNICNEDLAKINAVFDRGVTFWKNGDEIGNYAVDNRPV